jgi:2-methylcitrate dehydratase PrpD
VSTQTTARPDTDARPPNEDLAVDLARFVANLRYADLDPAVVDAVRTNVFDTLACALAGSTAPAIDQVTDLVQGWGGAPEANLFVFGTAVPAHHAAWANSGMAHARDFDDTHDAAILHAGVSAVPAAIAAAQLKGGVSGEELVAAVAAGLEVTCRLGVGVQVDIIETGFIYASLLGYFGATAAAGRVLGLTEDEMLNAFGIVYSSVAGNHQVTRDASLMKRLQPGLGAKAAVIAVQLARRGIRGAQHVFEGADGFNRVYLHDKIDCDVVRADLGRRYELLNLSYKPYPCCRDVHAAVDATLVAREETGRPAADIEYIEVGVTGPGYQMVCVPEHVRLAPRTIVEAQFSIPYTVAAAWHDGRLGFAHFSDEGLQRAEVMELTAKVRPYVDAGIDAEWKRYVTPAALRVHFRDGTSFETRVDYAKGHPRNPMDPAELRAKAAECGSMAARPAAGTAELLWDTVSRLETLPDVEELVRVMTR